MKKMRITLVSLLLAFAMIFAIACGNDNGTTQGGGGSGGNLPVNYEELLAQARQTLVEAGFSIEDMPEDMNPEHVPAGLIGGFVAVRNDGIIHVYLFDTRTNADATAEGADWGGGYVGQNGRIVFWASTENLVDMVIGVIGGELVGVHVSLSEFIEQVIEALDESDFLLVVGRSADGTLSDEFDYDAFLGLQVIVGARDIDEVHIYLFDTAANTQAFLNFFLNFMEGAGGGDGVRVYLRDRIVYMTWPDEYADGEAFAITHSILAGERVLAAGV